MHLLCAFCAKTITKIQARSSSYQSRYLLFLIFSVVGVSCDFCDEQNKLKNTDVDTLRTPVFLDKILSNVSQLDYLLCVGKRGSNRRPDGHEHSWHACKTYKCLILDRFLIRQEVFKILSRLMSRTWVAQHPHCMRCAYVTYMHSVYNAGTVKPTIQLIKRKKSTILPLLHLQILNWNKCKPSV